MKPLNLNKVLESLNKTNAALDEKKAAQAAARGEWKNADKPSAATVKSLDARLKAVEKLLGLIAE